MVSYHYPSRISVCVSLLLFVLLVLSPSRVESIRYGSREVVHEWTTLDFDWPSADIKDIFIADSSYYNPERNLVAGIKLYKGDVYLTIPRWRWNTGHPATLVKVVKVNGQVKLRPYPDWESQKLGNCSALQYVQSMEIDPNTGLMYVIDTGRTGLVGSVTPRNLCPAKMVVYNLKTNEMVKTYEFPDSVVSTTRNFINDLVLDYVDNQVRFAYITDVSEGKIYVFDFEKNLTFSVEDKSMKPEGNNGSVIHMKAKDYTFNAGVDGIAMSWDFRYVYYCPLGGYSLYQIPTENLRNVTANVDGNKTDMGIRLVGRKVSQSDGLAHGNKRLYYSILAWNAVYEWDFKRDMRQQRVPIDRVRMITQVKVTRHDEIMQWVDTLAFAEDGWLWFVSNRLQLFANGEMDFTGADGANVRIWKVYVNDTSYLHGADRRTGTLHIPIVG